MSLNFRFSHRSRVKQATNHQRVYVTTIKTTTNPPPPPLQHLTLSYYSQSIKKNKLCENSKETTKKLFCVMMKQNRIVENRKSLTTTRISEKSAKWEEEEENNTTKYNCKIIRSKCCDLSGLFNSWLYKVIIAVVVVVVFFSVPYICLSVCLWVLSLAFCRTFFCIIRLLLFLLLSVFLTTKFLFFDT